MIPSIGELFRAAAHALVYRAVWLLPAWLVWVLLAAVVVIAVIWGGT